MEELFDEYELPKNRKKRIISDLDDIENGVYDDFQAPTVILASTTSPKRKKKETEFDDIDDAASWLTTLQDLSRTKIKVSKHANDIWKKDKKKKKKKDERIDYHREFEQEQELVNNAIIAQSRFVESLQDRYDAMMSSKASAKGNSKFLTDFIDTLNSARQNYVSFIKQKVDIKKTIEDLEMKQEKALGGDLLGDDTNNFAAQFLKNIIAKESGVNYAGYGSIEDVDNEDDILDRLEINDELRSDDAKSYLKYENKNVRIEAVINPNDLDDYDFVAYAEDGEILPDYPLPDKTHLSLNRSTMIATDTYGQKFRFEWRDV